MPITKKIKINSYDVDRFGNLKLSVFMKLLQQAATDDLEEKNLSYDVLLEKNLIFIITGIKCKFKRNIKVDEVISLFTKSVSIKGITFTRDFWVYDSEKNLIAEAVSHWVLVDYDSRKLVRPSSIEFYYDSDNAIDFNIDRTLPDIINPDAEMCRCVNYTMLDQNCHLNNTCYSDLISDMIFTPDTPYSIKDIQILFKNEALFADNLSIKMTYTEDFGYVFEAYNITRENICFKANIILG